MSLRARHDRRLVILWWVGATVIGLTSACRSSTSECQTDGDCGPDSRCVSGGGIFFRGGRCVVEPAGVGDDTGPVDSRRGDVEPTDCADGAERKCDAVDGAADVRESGVADTDGVDTDRSETSTGVDAADGGGDSEDADAGRFAHLCRNRRSCPDTYCHELRDREQPCVHRLALTNGTVAADFANRTPGSRACVTAAKSSGVDGRWGLVIETLETPVRKRVDPRGPVVNLAGELIATSASDFWDGDIANPVATGFDRQRRGVAFWTGIGAASAGERRGKSCANWTSTMPFLRGVTGASSATDEWLAHGRKECSGKAHLLCIDGQ